MTEAALGPIAHHEAGHAFAAMALGYEACPFIWAGGGGSNLCWRWEGMRTVARSLLTRSAHLVNGNWPAIARMAASLIRLGPADKSETLRKRQEHICEES